MSNLPPALQLFDNGFTDLLSVVPPNGSLSPSTTLNPSQRGKAPGRRLDNGTWIGTSWRTMDPPSREEVEKWVLTDQANVGLRARNFPALDIDVLDQKIVRLIECLAFESLGLAPIRTGRAPKALLMYRTTSPFPKRKLSFVGGIVEFLGDGQQYLVAGTHPSGTAYAWDMPLEQVVPSALTEITLDQAEAFLRLVAAELTKLGVEGVELSGGRGSVHAVQDHLRATDLSALVSVVRAIPNTIETHPDREQYIKMGAAIAASWDEDEAFPIFAEWAMKWEGGNDPDTVRSDWRGLRPPFSIGYSWLLDEARKYGFNNARDEFEADLEPEAAPDDSSVFLGNAAPVIRVDADASRWISEQMHSTSRWVPGLGVWVVWDGSRWKQDHANAFPTALMAKRQELYEITQNTDPQMRKRILAGPSGAWFEKQMTQMPGMSIDHNSLDFDPDLLNTPAGTVDLRTGALRPHNPDDLITQSTLCGPQPRVPEKWIAFLHEATAGNIEYVDYLQRVCGYLLTGHCIEEVFFMLWGLGGNGKGVFMKTVATIMGDYAQTAPADILGESQANGGEGPKATLASLRMARLAYETELPPNFRMGDDRMKRLTGRDPITARVPYAKAPMTFVPKFKIMMASNNKPTLASVDPGLRRRLHMMPFVVKPQTVNMRLREELISEEAPAILNWMIEGTMIWQAQGLRAPAVVIDETEEYLSDQDLPMAWASECLEPSEGEALLSDLFNSWSLWGHRFGIRNVGDSRKLASALRRMGYERKHTSRGTAILNVSLTSDQPTFPETDV